MEKIKKIAKEAGEILLGFRTKKLNIQTKADETDFVTEADKASDNYLRSEISKLYPNDLILSEESDVSIDDFTKRVWIIDPMDATSDFINHENTFSVMIGLVVEGRPVLGLVYAPVSNTFYWAKKYEGTWKQVANNDPVKLSVSTVDSFKRSTFVTSNNESTSTLVESLITKDFLFAASGGLKAGLVAEGKADAVYFMDKNVGKWDYCASDILIHEAGGMFTDNTGNILDYSLPDSEFPKQVICSNGKLHQKLITHYTEFSTK